MKTTLLTAALSVVMASHLSGQGSAPTYSIADYCESVSQAVGGSYGIKAQCIKDENAALQRVLDGGYVEERITNYCRQVAEAVGGSYTIYEQCLKDEAEAKSEIK